MSKSIKMLLLACFIFSVNSVNAKDQLIVSTEQINNQPQLSYVVFEKGRRTAILVPRKVNLESGMFLDEYRSSNGASWAISGGLLKSFSRVLPLGFLKVSGTVLSDPAIVAADPNKLLDSVICVSEIGSPTILDTTTWQKADWTNKTDSYPSCVQTGPALVRNHIPVQELNPEMKTRLFLSTKNLITPFFCIDDQGRTVLGIGLGTSSKIAEMIYEKTTNGPHCVDAVRMTGGATGGLVGPEVGQNFGNTSIRLPDAIGVW